MILLLSLLVAARAQSDDYDDLLYRQLAAFDPPPCGQLFQDRDPAETRDELLRYAREHRLSAPVAMRSVSCLLSQLPDDPLVQQAATEWVEDRSCPGFALIVAQGLDHMPEARAVELGRGLLRQGAEQPQLRIHLLPTLQRSRHAGVRSLLAEVPTED